MIKPETYYEVVCDRCGRKYMEGDTVIAFGTMYEAAEAVKETGWFCAHRSGCVYCPDCFADESNE